MIKTPLTFFSVSPNPPCPVISIDPELSIVDPSTMLIPLMSSFPLPPVPLRTMLPFASVVSVSAGEPVSNVDCLIRIPVLLSDRLGFAAFPPVPFRSIAEARSVVSST